MKPTALSITIVTLTIILAAAAGSPVASAVPMSLSVTVVGADHSDPRWRAVEEAMAFWNRQLREAGVKVRLGPITRLIQPVPDDALQARPSSRAASNPIFQRGFGKFRATLSSRYRPTT